MRRGHREKLEEALRVWERSGLVALAREGYRRSAREDLADAEAYLSVLDEIARKLPRG